MRDRVNINVSSIDYDKTSKEIISTLSKLEEMVHSEDEFVITDSEFAFGWHFFVVSVNSTMIQKLADQLGPEFENLRGKSFEKKFLTWLTLKMGKNTPRFKLAIKEEMESSKYGLF